MKHITKIILYILACLVIVSGVICGIGVYKEITNKSYINGDALGFENAFKQENFNYKTTSIAFYKEPAEVNIYTYNIDLLPVTEFDGSNKQYEIIFNNNEILNANINAGEVEFEQLIEFLGTNKEVINETNIIIRLEFYADKTKLKVVAKTENIAYLEQYLQLNSFHLRINEIRS